LKGIRGNWRGDIQELGGQMTLNVVKFAAHDYWAGWFQCPELVDSGGGATVYAELLIDCGERTWRGLLTDQDMLAIPFRHFRVLRMEGVVNKGYEWRS